MLIPESVPLRSFMRRYVPSSFDQPWSWDDEANFLFTHEPEKMEALIESIRMNGQSEPVLLGPDGRLWDGHHRIVALNVLAEQEEQFVLVEVWRRGRED